MADQISASVLELLKEMKAEREQRQKELQAAEKQREEAEKQAAKQREEAEKQRQQDRAEMKEQIKTIMEFSKASKSDAQEAYQEKIPTGLFSIAFEGSSEKSRLKEWQAWKRAAMDSCVAVNVDHTVTNWDDYKDRDRNSEVLAKAAATFKKILPAFKTNLRGSALNVSEGCKEQGGFQIPETFQRLELFATANPRLQRMLGIQSLVSFSQKGSVSQIFGSLRDTVEHLGDLKPEELALSVLSTNLAKPYADLSSKILAAKDLNEAESLMSEREVSLMASSSRQETHQILNIRNQKVKKYCGFCKKKGHLPSECWNKNSNKEGRKGRGKQGKETAAGIEEASKGER